MPTPIEYISDFDTDTHRACGTCGKLKELTEFYKDGKDSKGNIRYRRDCKDCYKKQRIQDFKRKIKDGAR